MAIRRHNGLLLELDRRPHSQLVSLSALGAPAPCVKRASNSGRVGSSFVCYFFAHAMAFARLGRLALRGPQLVCMSVRPVSSAAAPGGAARTKNFGVSVFSEFTPLAQAHKAVNLGQGFPDFEAPAFVISAAQEALGKHLNQYTRSMGHLRLVTALAKFYAPKFGRTLSALTEVVVTAGATEAIFTGMQALINPGDEVHSL